MPTGSHPAASTPHDGDEGGGPVRWNLDRAKLIIAAEARREGPLLPILHALQHEFGCVPEAATAVIAQALNLSRAEVHGVISFYHDFRRTPAGRRELKLCRAEACQARGGRETERAISAALGIEMGETTPGGVTLTPVYCLGLCASGPAALIDGRPLGRLTPEAALSLVPTLQP